MDTVLAAGLHFRIVSVLLDMVLNPSWVSFWTAVIAATAIVQVILLVVNALLVLGYLRETKRMRRATQEQVSKTQALVEIAQKQLSAGLAQTEAQIRPAVAVRLQGGIQLQNVGNGTAVDVAFAFLDDLAGELSWALRSNIISEIVASYLECGEDPDRRAILADRRLRPDNGLQLRYQSLSGKKYASLITFGMDGRVIQTRFVEEAK